MRAVLVTARNGMFSSWVQTQNRRKFMQKRLLLVGSVVVALAIAATAGAVTRSQTASLRAAPFDAAAVPSTLAAQKAKNVLVFGMEQDVTGFNIADTNEDATWAAIPGQ